MSMKMERNRESRRVSILGSNGFNRRGLRTSSLTGSPEYGGGVEWPESVRLRDRVNRHRDCRERKRVHDETSEESLNDDEYDDRDEATASATVAGRLFLPSPPSGSVSTDHHGQQHTNNHHLQLRRSFPPGFSSSSTSEVFGATHVWRPSDEIIGVTVPRKPRSASAKRSRDWNSSRTDGGCAGGAKQILQRASGSPASQPGCASTSAPPPAVPMSPPSSSNSFFKKKLKSGESNTEAKLKPPMASSSTGHASSSAAEDLELEIAEVLFGLMTQSQGPSEKDNSKEVQRSKGDVTVVAPARKRLRPVAEKTGRITRIDPAAVELDMNQPPESEILSSSSGSEKAPGSASGNGFEGRGSSVNSDGRPAAQAQPQDVKERESGNVKNEDDLCSDSSLTATASSSVAGDSITVKTCSGSAQARSSSPESSAPSGQANLLAEERKSKGTGEETESCKKIDSQRLEVMPVQMKKEGSAAEKSGQPESPIYSGCPDGLSFIRHMAPAKNSATVSPSSTRRLITLPSLKRCARHFLIARNIDRHQKVMKMMDPSRNRADKGVASTPDRVVKEKGGSRIVTSSNAVENKQQQHVIQNEKLPSVGPSNLLQKGPMSLNQHEATRPISSSKLGPSLSNPASPTSSISFNYPPPMDTSQYPAMLQNNNAYRFPIGPHYRGETLVASGGAGSRARTSILGPNFAMPVHPQLLVQNRAIFQSFPEATGQHHIQMMAPGQKSNNFIIAEGEKLRIRDVSTDEAERENLAEKAQQPIIPLMSSGSIDSSNVVTGSSGQSMTASSVTAGKYLSNFPQNLTQSNNGCRVQSPHWSYLSKTPFSQAQSSLPHSNPNQYHQSQPQTQNQISFSANQKLPTTAQAQSPTNSSVSTKAGQTPIFSPQLPKNLLSNPSTLGNRNVMTAMQAQLYPQVRFPHSAVRSFSPNGVYMHRTRPDQHLQPVLLPNSLTRNDPSKAIVATTSDVTGGSSIHTARIGGTLLPAGFLYIHPVVQGANQMKPAEQK
ncbi:Protein TIME FOR COFFEE [Striga hermonthica]|uniref:Protein TIME FOR COFFEE n=1 Tax=Striga hermonthica TaxID=68872 RepID=A0A9N7NHP7_STRHE|nr:Protein TIME FOR COFFEE [Striga hermonthica]